MENACRLGGRSKARSLQQRHQDVHVWKLVLTQTPILYSNNFFFNWALQMHYLTARLLRRAFTEQSRNEAPKRKFASVWTTVILPSPLDEFRLFKPPFPLPRCLTGVDFLLMLTTVTGRRRGTGRGHAAAIYINIPSKTTYNHAKKTGLMSDRAALKIFGYFEQKKKEKRRQVIASCDSAV